MIQLVKLVIGYVFNAEFILELNPIVHPGIVILIVSVFSFVLILRVHLIPFTNRLKRVIHEKSNFFRTLKPLRG